MSKKYPATEQFLGYLKQLLQSPSTTVYPEALVKTGFDFRRGKVVSESGRRFTVLSLLSEDHAELTVREEWQPNGKRRVFGIRYGRRVNGELSDLSTFYEFPFRLEPKEYFQPQEDIYRCRPSREYPRYLSKGEIENFCQEILSSEQAEALQPTETRKLTE